MTASSLTPAPILQLVSGLWAAGVLKAGLDLQVFDHLSARPQDASSLSRMLEADASSLQILLDALTALQLLDITPQGYALTEVSDAFLVSTKPAYLGGMLSDTTISPLLFDLYKDYQRVVTERHRINPWEYGEGSNPRILRLTQALFTLGTPIAHVLADHMGWTPENTAALQLLDVGCGSAVYGLVALTRLRHARLTAQDWPLILPVAQAHAARLGVAERLQPLAGDLRTIDFGGPYDVVFLGHILHNYDEETCRKIVRRCMDALAPGGAIAVIEFLAERGQPASTFAWLFSTMIRGTTNGGRSFAAAELRQMLTEAGAARTEVGGELPVGFVLGYRA
jgi:2-polyprenyl-3-methyl-5-hydroxy-6-metoxy-1,4-benzoquinol methylase